MSSCLGLYEGHTTPGVMQQNIGGIDATAYLAQLVRQRTGLDFSSSANFHVLDELKRRYSYVAQDYAAELDQYVSPGTKTTKPKPVPLSSAAATTAAAAPAAALATTTPSSASSSTSSTATSATAPSTAAAAVGSHPRLQHCALPDGQQLLLSRELFQCNEVFFQPRLLRYEMLPLAHMVRSCIMKAPVSTRDYLGQNIVVTGAAATSPGFLSRLDSELRALLPSDLKPKLIATPAKELVLGQWIGGSILSSLSTFQSMWISKEEYDESGPSVPHYRKCF